MARLVVGCKARQRAREDVVNTAAAWREELQCATPRNVRSDGATAVRVESSRQSRTTMLAALKTLRGELEPAQTCYIESAVNRSSGAVAFTLVVRPEKSVAADTWLCYDAMLVCPSVTEWMFVSSAVAWWHAAALVVGAAMLASSLRMCGGSTESFLACVFVGAMVLVAPVLSYMLKFDPPTFKEPARYAAWARTVLSGVEKEVRELME